MARAKAGARFARTCWLISVSALFLNGCANTLDAPLLDVRHQPQSLAQGYRLSLGEKIKIAVFGEPDLTGTYEISAQGAIAMPLVGEIRAAGVTPDALRTAIAGRLAKGYVKNPRVSVEVLTYRPIYVHGEVRSGGEFPFKAGVRLSDAIALAGGFSYRAAEDYILLQRDGLGRPMRVRTADNLTLLPGDNIRVPERFF